MYYHEVEKDIEAGNKVHRLSWPKGHYIVPTPVEAVELNEEEAEKAGLDPDAVVSVGRIFLYCSDSKNAVLGYNLTSEDKASQDWQVVIEKK